MESSLFRYLSDESVVEYLIGQREVLMAKGHENEAKLVEEVGKKFFDIKW